MKWTHVKLVSCLLASFAAIGWAVPAEAQLAPMGTHYAGRATDTGHAAPTDSGGYATAVPLELPPSRGGLPVPVQIVSGSRGFGAAGVGWDVPLSFVQFDFIGHRRPAFSPGEPIDSRERVSVSLPGQRLEMVRQGSGWIARNAAAVTMRVENQKFKVFDGQGLTYTFADKASDIPHLTLLSGTGRFLLESVPLYNALKVVQ